MSLRLDRGGQTGRPIGARAGQLLRRQAFDVPEIGAAQVGFRQIGMLHVGAVKVGIVVEAAGAGATTAKVKLVAAI